MSQKQYKGQELYQITPLQAEALFRKSIPQGLRKFWVEDQNLDKCPACRDDQRPCKCGLL